MVRSEGGVGRREVVKNGKNEVTSFLPFFEYAMTSLTNSVVPSMVSRLGATKVSKKYIYHNWFDRKEEWEGELCSKMAKNEVR